MTAAPRRPSTEEVTAAAAVLKLLADPTRLAVLAMLEREELSVGTIAERLDRPLPAVSQHLAKLRAHGLVVARRDGSSVRYSQPDAHVARLVTNALHHAEHLLHETPPHHAA
ncbi:metalloregulator ArsR/SmtB family transcription factor [Agrococcus sp. TF02-05]|uniref:ArsR/SmtB family transcription factor n=1 Tax=Agrococcus sp. TF02-05 TaxID=2815211 RepID=UPI001AA1C829|nr:metalloregulator ArsR/SmtB family transcription factor [Agrococcus sp. TF02-05]MBO1770106.1 helix-turn-helix transcriptional regulator [Agrococcus sp. TF02-05]